MLGVPSLRLHIDVRSKLTLLHPNDIKLKPKCMLHRGQLHGLVQCYNVRGRSSQMLSWLVTHAMCTLHII